MTHDRPSEEQPESRETGPSTAQAFQPPEPSATPSGAGASPRRPRFVHGSTVFSWMAATVSLWFVLPSHSARLIVAALIFGLGSILLATFARRRTSPRWPRELAVIAIVLPYVAIPVMRSSGATWPEYVETGALTLATPAVLLLAADAMSRERHRVSWPGAIGLSLAILAVFAYVSGLRTHAASADPLRLIHSLGVPLLAVGCWFFARRNPELRLFAAALMIGLALPFLALFNLASFIAFGGLGFLLYIGLQVVLVFASARFLERTGLSRRQRRGRAEEALARRSEHSG